MEIMTYLLIIEALDKMVIVGIIEVDRKRKSTLNFMFKGRKYFVSIFVVRNNLTNV